MLRERKKTMDERKTDLLALLLRPELPNVLRELPTEQYKVKRLSELAGPDVVFTLRGLPYGKVEELREVRQEQELMILLAGCPELKEPALMERFGGATPAETVKAMLLPGEIADLSRAVERLSGYRMNTIREIKNGCGRAATGS